MMPDKGKGVEGEEPRTNFQDPNKSQVINHKAQLSSESDFDFEFETLNYLVTKPGDWFLVAYLTSNCMRLSSSMKPSSSSPTTNSPTPAGVPVKTRSPMLTEK